MKEIFGAKCDYLSLFKKSYDRQFIDIKESNKNNIDYYILEGIKMYKRENSKSIVEIISNRELFKNLIYFLNESWGIRYSDIAMFFEITRETMNSLRKNDFGRCP